jgi:hypothetical protein
LNDFERVASPSDLEIAEIKEVGAVDLIQSDRKPL